MANIQMTFLDRLVHKPRTFAARGWIFQIHLYTGLLVALYAVVVGLSGSAVVFRPQIRDYQWRNLMYVNHTGIRVSPDRVMESVNKAFPDLRIASILFPQSERETFRVNTGPTFNDRPKGSYLSRMLHNVYVDPFTAEIIGEQKPTVDFVRTLQLLHFDLLGGRTGRIINASFSLVLLVMAATGIVIWWPGAALWIRSLSINWRANWKRINYDIHSAVAAYSLIFFVIMSLTGFYYGWPIEVRNFISGFSPVRQMVTAPTFPTPPPGAQQAPVSRLVEIATKYAPSNSKILRVTYVFLGSQERPVSEIRLHNKAVQVVFSHKGVYDDADLSFIYLDPYTMKVIRADRADDRSLGDAISAWIPSVHFGTFAGLPSQFLWFFLGLTPSILGVTGLLMWWNRVPSKKVRRWRMARAVGEAREDPATNDSGLRGDEDEYHPERIGSVGR